jgi:hypothetical protein
MEQRRVGISRDASGDDIYIRILFQNVVTRDLVFLATFFLEPAHPQRPFTNS